MVSRNCDVSALSFHRYITFILVLCLYLCIYLIVVVCCENHPECRFLILSCISGCVTIDGVWIGEWIFWSLIYTTWNDTLQITDMQRLVSSAITVSTSRFLATASTEGDCSASRTQVLLSQPPVKNSCQLITNWVPGWRPFHTNLLVFPSQADFQLNCPVIRTLSSPTRCFTSLHLSELDQKNLLYDWRFTANHFVLASSPLRLTTGFFFSTETLLS
jgi:hypothetical protein